MYKIELSEADKKELEACLSSEKRSKIYRRLLWLDLNRRGYSQKEIGKVLGMSPAQMTSWAKIFLKEGFKGLCRTNYEDRRPSKLMPYLDRIREKVQKDCVSTLSSLQSWIGEELEIFIEQSWLSRLIKKNSIVLSKRPD